MKPEVEAKSTKDLPHSGRILLVKQGRGILLLGMWRFITVWLMMGLGMLRAADTTVVNSTASPALNFPTPAEFLRLQVVPTSDVLNLISKFNVLFESGRALTPEEWLSLIPHTASLELHMALKKGALKAAESADSFVNTLLDSRSPYSETQAYRAAQNILLESELETLQNRTGTTPQHYRRLMSIANPLSINIALFKAAVNFSKTPQDIIASLLLAPENQPDKTYLAERDEVILQTLPALVNDSRTTSQDLMKLFIYHSSDLVRLKIKREAALKAKTPTELVHALREEGVGPSDTGAFQIQHQALVLEMLPRFSEFPETQSTDVLAVFDAGRVPKNHPDRFKVRKIALANAKTLKQVLASLSIFDGYRVGGVGALEIEALIEDFAPSLAGIPDIKSDDVLSLSKLGELVTTSISLKRAAAKLSKNARELSHALAFTHYPDPKKPAALTPEYLNEINILILELLNEWDRFPNTPWREFVPVFDVANGPETKLALKKKAMTLDPSGANLVEVLSENGSQSTRLSESRHSSARGALIAETVENLSQYPNLQLNELMALYPLAPDSRVKSQIKRILLKKSTNFGAFKTALALGQGESDFRSINDELIIEFQERFSGFPEQTPTHYSQIFSLSSGSKYIFEALLPPMTKTEGIESKHFLQLETSSIPTLIHMKHTAVKLAKNANEFTTALYARPPSTLELWNDPAWTAAESDLMLELMPEWDRFPNHSWQDFGGAFNISEKPSNKWAYMNKALKHVKNEIELVDALSEFGDALVELDPKYLGRVSDLIMESIPKLKASTELKWSRLSKLLKINLDADTRIAINEVGCHIAQTPEEFVEALTQSGLKKPDPSYEQRRVDTLLVKRLSKLSEFPTTSSKHYLQLINASANFTEFNHIVDVAFRRTETAFEARELFIDLHASPRRQVSWIKMYFLNHLKQLGLKKSMTLNDVLFLFQLEDLHVEDVFKIKTAMLHLVKNKDDLKMINESKPTKFIIGRETDLYDSAQEKFLAFTSILFFGAFSPMTGKLTHPIDEILRTDLGLKTRRPDPISETIKSSRDIILRFDTFTKVYNQTHAPNGQRRAALRMLLELPKLYRYAPELSFWLNFEILAGITGKEVLPFRSRLAQLVNSSDELLQLMPKDKGLTRSTEEYLLADRIVRQSILRFPKDAEAIAKKAVSAQLLDMRKFYLEESDIVHPESRFLARLKIKTGFLTREEKEFPVRVIESGNNTVTVVSEQDFTEAVSRKVRIPIFRVPKGSLIRTFYPKLDPAVRANLNLNKTQLQPIAMALVSPLARINRDSSTAGSELGVLFYLREYLKGNSPQEAVSISQKCLETFIKTRIGQP